LPSHWLPCLLQDRVKQLKKEHGSKTLGNVTVEQVRRPQGAPEWLLWLLPLPLAWPLCLMPACLWIAQQS
jgi:hypothetical protein